MSTRVKRKVKLKKKNFIIFLIIIFIILFITTKSIHLIIHSLSNPSSKEIKEVKEIPKKEKVKEKKLSKEEEKYNKLDNINKEIDYFNNDYLDRYLNYQAKNKYLPTEQIIKNVNMNLDLTQYKNTIKAKNLNTPKVLVNKYYYPEEDYIPNNLEKISSMYALSGMKLVDYAKDAFEEMAKAAAKKNLNIVAMSSYRSYSYQINLYNRYAKSDGKEKADTYSGRPGHSEHQTGLAVDIYNQKENYTNFEKTKEYDWMLEHAHEYGFILRFPKDKEEETGYHFESWHYRYVGKDIAKYIKENNISFEEYYATKIKDW